MQAHIPNLNSQQRAAAEHPGGPLLIAAGAGSGKTHTLTSRIYYLLSTLAVPPEKILAITFTNKAAEEMRRRVIQDSRFRIQDLFIGTFHSFGARLLRLEARRLGRTADFAIFDENDSLSIVKGIIKSYNLPKEDYAPPAVRALISNAKNELASRESHIKECGLMDSETVTALFADYELMLEKNNAFDFDDLIEKPVRLMQAHPDFLAVMQARYLHILIDEYQDINTVQYKLVRALAHKHQNISVVGDDAQSIYAFRGADFRNFLNFERDWQNATVVLLEENYRSTPTILAAANAIIKNNTLQKQKNLWTKNPAGDLIRVYAATDENDEAEWVVKEILKLTTSQVVNLENIALIYRTNAQSRALEQTLIAAGIPYRIFGGIRFYDRKEIKDILAALRLANNPADTVSAERLRKNFSKGKAVLLLHHLPDVGKTKTIIELIDYFMNTTHYLEYLKNNYQNYEDRLENIQGLISFAENFEGGDLTNFLEQATLAQGHDTPQGRKGVNLMTIHLSKGLEFNTVFVVGASEGTLPHHRSYETLEGMEEERRLMYVAITRAEKNAFLSFSNIPSRFLHEIDGDLIRFTNAENKSSRGYLGRRRGAGRAMGAGRARTLPNEDELWLDYE